MIKVCANGHVTGYRQCPQCRAETTPQSADHSEFPEVRAARIARQAEPSVLPPNPVKRAPFSFVALYRKLRQQKAAR